MKNENSRLRNEGGFTLVELLVVILIIGILAAIAVPIFLNQRKTAAEAVLVTDLKSVVLAQQSALIKNPSSAGTIKKSELNQTAKRLSNETVVGTWFVNGIGYCVVGYNKGAIHSGGAGELNYMWYDSALGGFVTPPDNATPPLNGACASPRPSTHEQAWYYDSSGWVSNY
jgi:type IV pilus assembly protein PilA